MAADVYSMVKSCTDWPSTGTIFGQQRGPERFPPSGSLKFVTIDIHGPLVQTRFGGQYVVIITNTYGKLTQALPTQRPHGPRSQIYFQPLGFPLRHQRHYLM